MDYSDTLLIFDEVKLFYPNKRMGVFGGSFNPIHNGHINMALSALAEFSLESVLLVPSANPPHKKNRTDVAPANARLTMAALCALQCPALKVSDIELKREGYSYTVDTLRQLLREYKDTDIYFLIGSDSLFQLENWHDPSELFRLARFICVRRPGNDRIKIAAQAAYLNQKYGAVIEISQNDGLLISSSMVRGLIAEGKSIEDYVPSAVRDYIYASGLYQ